MKKFLGGFLLAVLLLVPVGAHAWGESRVITAADYYVDKFTDGDAVCYVSNRSDGSAVLWHATSVSTAISCVKESR